MTSSSPRVGYENDDDRADQAHGLPTLFAVDDAIQAADVERILEDEPGGLEAVILCLARLCRSFSSSQTNRMIVVAFLHVQEHMYSAGENAQTRKRGGEFDGSTVTRADCP